jgi:hypothetical protein
MHLPSWPNHFSHGQSTFQDLTPFAATETVYPKGDPHLFRNIDHQCLDGLDNVAVTHGLIERRLAARRSSHQPCLFQEVHILRALTDLRTTSPRYEGTNPPAGTKPDEQKSFASLSSEKEEISHGLIKIMITTSTISKVGASLTIR